MVAFGPPDKDPRSWWGRALRDIHRAEGLGLSPARSGSLIAPVGLGLAVASAVAPRLVARSGLLVPAGGIALNAVGLAGVAAVDAVVAAAARPTWLLPVLLVVRIGRGLAINPLIGLVVASVGAPDAGVASGIQLTTTQVGNALGVAVVGSAFLGPLASTSRSGPAAFSHALAWTMALLVVMTWMALPLLLRLRGQQLIRPPRG